MRAPTAAQLRVLGPMAEGQYIYLAGGIIARASLWPPPKAGRCTTVRMDTLHAIRKAGWIHLTADGMGREAPKGNMPWYARRYDITPAGRAAVPAPATRDLRRP